MTVHTPIEAAPLLRRDEAGVAWLTLNRPTTRNALSSDMMRRLQAALSELGTDPSVRVVVIAGAGPGFCGGHDLREMRANREQGFLDRLFAQCSALMTQIVRQPQPVIARVHGIATAAGCQLVASCDLALASTEARFAVSGINVGLFCSTPMVALSRAVGRKAAMEMLLTGAMIDAHRAREIGLVNRVVAPEALDEAVSALAADIASKSRRAIGLGKEAFYRQAEMGLDEAYRYTASVMTCNMLADDAAEGIDAFLEKRPPHWTDA
jgi:enoyl-CoA hydratase/carnithine racemase